jgi:hypothetical protein
MKKGVVFAVLLGMSVQTFASIFYEPYTVINKSHHAVKIAIHNENANGGFFVTLPSETRFRCKSAACSMYYPSMSHCHFQGTGIACYQMGDVTIPQCGRYRLKPRQFVTIKSYRGKLYCV